MILENFAAPAYFDRSLGNALRCVNLCPVKVPQGFKLVSTPGLQRRTQSGNGSPCRGGIVDYSYTKMYSVNGNTVFIIDAGTNTWHALATTLDTSSGRVQMCCGSDNTVLLVDGTSGYIIDSAINLTKIADLNFPTNPTSCCYVDGQFYVTSGAAGEDQYYYRSQLGDGLDWTPVEFGSAETNSDTLKAVATDGQILFLIGKASLEKHYNTGEGFERISGSTQSVGTNLVNSVATFDSKVFYVGSSNVGVGSVWMIENQTAVRISTPDIEQQIRGLVVDSTAFGFAYMEDDGRISYQLTLGDDYSAAYERKTFVFDYETKSWWQRKSYGLTYHRAAIILNWLDEVVPIGYPGRIKALDAIDDYIHYYSDDYNVENGGAFDRIKEFGPFSTPEALSMNRMVFHFQVKHDSASTYTLTATLQWSDDRGLSWNTGEAISKSVTANGTTAQLLKFVFNKLGMSDDRIFRLTISGIAAKMVLENPSLNFEKGRN